MFEVDNKTTWLHVRLTEKERKQLELQMKNIGYRSKSKYARAKILDERIKIDKNVVLTDRLLRNQINALFFGDLGGDVGAGFGYQNIFGLQNNRSFPV